VKFKRKSEKISLVIIRAGNEESTYKITLYLLVIKY